MADYATAENSASAKSISINNSTRTKKVVTTEHWEWNESQKDWVPVSKSVETTEDDPAKDWGKYNPYQWPPRQYPPFTNPQPWFPGPVITHVGPHATW